MIRLELAVVYREMGLIDECIDELRLAMKDPSLAFASRRELGLCYKQKGDMEQATRHLQEAIRNSGASSIEELHDAMYDLAQIMEEIGSLDQALTLYQEISEKNASYRDIRKKIQSLSS